MGGGVAHIDLPVSQLKSVVASPSSSASASGNLRFSPTDEPSSSVSQFAGYEESGGRLRWVNEKRGRRGSGISYNLDFGPVPSQSEVEKALSALLSLLQGLFSRGSALQWIQPVLDGLDTRTSQSEGCRRLYEACQFLQTDPFFKRLVISLCSDKAVWDAVVRNEILGKLHELPPSALIHSPEEGDGRPEGPIEGDLRGSILRWILEFTMSKVVELTEKFLSLVNDVLSPPQREKAGEVHERERSQIEEKVRSSLLLSVVILLIVVVARFQGA